MKAAQLVAPKRWEFTEVETPTAADGQVLVKMERVSVCGSDIRHTYGPVLDESEYPLAPCRGAHELAGVIVDSKTDEYHEGQRVIVIPFAGTGGLCEYVLSAPGRIAVLPEYGGLDEWVLCQPPGTVLYSCRQIGSPLQQNILIFGQGSIGLSFTMILSRMGARNVIVVDPLDYRLEKSKQMGSTHQINPDKQDVNEAVMEITKGHGPDVCVEAAGYPDSLNECFRHVRQFGQVIVFGVQTDHMVPIEHNLWMDKQPRITPTTGARSGDPISQIQDMVDLRARGWADPAELITHRIGFSDVQKAYDMYEQREDGIIKVVMNINS